MKKFMRLAMVLLLSVISTCVYSSKKSDEIFKLIRERDFEAVKEKIEKGPVDFKDKYGNTLLMCAMWNDFPELILYLLEKGVNIDERNKDGETALYKASGNDVYMVKYLLDKGADPTIKDSKGYSIIVNAIREDNYDAVSLLLPVIDENERSYALKKALQYSNPKIVDMMHQFGVHLILDNPLVISPFRKRIDIIRVKQINGIKVNDKLIEHEIQPGLNTLTLELEAINMKGEALDLKINAIKGEVYELNSEIKVPKWRASYNVVYPIHGNIGRHDFKKKNDFITFMTAIIFGQIEKVYELVEKGVDVNGKDYNGYTPLMAASEFGRSKCLDFLLSKGAEIDSKDNKGRNALFHAIRKNNIPIIKKLLEIKNDLINEKDLEGSTLLKVSLDRYLPSIAKLLINAGSDFTTDIMNSAIKQGYYEIVESMLKKGYDVNQFKSGGWTPLMAAAAYGFSDIAELLINNGAKLDIQNSYGFTAAMNAVNKGHLEVLKLLIERGADLNIKNKRGFNCLSLAKKYNKKFVKILKKAGAK
ncbi:MAG: ankyrin repeat domain-containing protein [Candidatus Aureabacteria bacterium]|nr:ankyrin repeat domain-containing protein [Candidatus Auribacterota bacterium]